jgi:hypothetical protein
LAVEGLLSVRMVKMPNIAQNHTPLKRHSA